MKYTIRCKNKWTNTYFAKEVEGEPIEILPEYEFFLHETSAGDMGLTPEPWTVTEKSTGRVCGMGKTKEEAIKQARVNVIGAGDRFPSLIAKMLEVNKTLFP